MVPYAGTLPQKRPGSPVMILNFPQLQSYKSKITTDPA